jgi:calcium-dependent protein kinase
VSAAQQVIPGTHSAADTPFAAAAQRAPSRNAFDSDLGFPTDFGERYKLIEEIGSGSFGTVYAAEDVESGESVAVKILPKDGAAGRRTRGSGRAGRSIVLAKLKKELDVLQRLQASGNAIELLGTFEDRSCVYIVMEECRGGDLETLLEDHGPLHEADVARIMHEALQTVAACHKHSLYHGDVKPANFMLRDEARPGAKGLGLEKQPPGTWLRAIDFGCAQQVEEGVPLTRKTGTPMFMAPEVFIGNYGMEADMWAAGMMMYQLIADRFPWWSTMEELNTTTLEAVMEAVIQKDIPMDYGPWKAMSQEGMDLIHAMLQRDAGERISAEEALQHPWFAKHGVGVPPQQRASIGNILPLNRSFSRRLSDSLRLKMSAAELSRAQSRPASGLSGLLDDMLDIHGEQPAGSAELCATFA